MKAAIITVGDELLAGDIDNTNATWLAARLTGRGVGVRRIVTLPDSVDVIADYVRRYSEATDAVLVTGGIGGTPDDVTIEGVAAAFDRPLEVDPIAREEVERTIEEIRERRSDVTIDVEAEASLPVGSRPLRNDEGLSPGCALENVFVFPGIPPEMKAMFESVADEFAGVRYERLTRTARPESNIIEILEHARDEFGVAVGSYPEPDGGEKRIKVTGDDEERVRSAYDWLRERL